MSAQPHYSMIIQWSEEDQAYIVSFPEWEAHGLIGHTHDETYAEAVRKGQEVLRMLIDSAHAEGEQLPRPHIFAGVERVS